MPNVPSPFYLFYFNSTPTIKGWSFSKPYFQIMIISLSVWIWTVADPGITKTGGNDQQICRSRWSWKGTETVTHGWVGFGGVGQLLIQRSKLIESGPQFKIWGQTTPIIKYLSYHIVKILTCGPEHPSSNPHFQSLSCHFYDRFDYLWDYEWEHVKPNNIIRHAYVDLYRAALDNLNLSSCFFYPIVWIDPNDNKCQGQF